MDDDTERSTMATGQSLRGGGRQHGWPEREDGVGAPARSGCEGTGGEAQLVDPPVERGLPGGDVVQQPHHPEPLAALLDPPPPVSLADPPLGIVRDAGQDGHVVGPGQVLGDRRDVRRGTRVLGGVVRRDDDQPTAGAASSTSATWPFPRAPAPRGTLRWFGLTVGSVQATLSTIQPGWSAAPRHRGARPEHAESPLPERA